MQRAFVSVLSGSVEAAARFYQDLLGLTRHFDSDWFIILTHPEMAGLEFGILQRDHAIVPIQAQTVPSGVMMTFVVDDCDKVHAQAMLLGADIIQAPTDMPYGQRRMLVRDLDGTVVDISAPTAPVR